MTLLAQAIAREEGWGIHGDLPTRQNNPGDLRHAPGEMHAPANPNGIGSFATAAEGWDALERQLMLYAERGMTIASMITDAYAPPTKNNSAQYVANVCAFLHCTSDTPVSTALGIS